MADRHLVMIEWLDSVGCSSNWGSLDHPIPTVPLVRSVGWLIHDDENCKIIVPHLIESHPPNIDAQGCGEMLIPTFAVKNIVDIPRRTIENLLAVAEADVLDGGSEPGDEGPGPVASRPGEMPERVCGGAGVTDDPAVKAADKILAHAAPHPLDVTVVLPIIREAIAEATRPYENVRAYLCHAPTCSEHESGPDTCDCGLARLLREIPRHD